MLLLALMSALRAKTTTETRRWAIYTIKLDKPKFIKFFFPKNISEQKKSNYYINYNDTKKEWTKTLAL